MAAARSRQLAAALALLEGLTSAQRITQESLDTLSQAVAALPSESRSALVNFLISSSSSLWVAAFVEGVKKLVAGG